MKKQYYSRAEKGKIRRKGSAVLLGLFLICVLAAVGYEVIDHRPVQVSRSEASINVTEIHGIRCRRKTRMKTYLVMGTDVPGPVRPIGEEEEVGQCDVLLVLVIDQNADTYAVLPINRNTITEVKSLETDGTYIASSEVQIAMAHANGDGLEISCENTVDAVSHLLYDQPVDGYISLNMDAIRILNHMADGVPVTIEDDFSDADPSLKTGETIVLTDDQAMHFVHDRMNVGDGTNEGRMRRQKAFLEGLKSEYEQKLAQNDSFALDVYEALQDYMVTTFSGKDCSKLAKAMMKNEYLGMFQIEGESSLDEYGFDQFIPDQDSLADIVVELFYERLDGKDEKDV